MESCIISTAQQARPKVIHISEPVRAHWMSSSVVVTRKPLSASSSLIEPKKASSAPSGLPVAGSTRPFGAGATIGLAVDRIPALPFSIRTRNSYGQHAEEDHHRPKAECAEVVEDDRPGEQKRDLEVEDDEEQ